LAKAKEISAAFAPYVDKTITRKQFNMLIAYALPDIDGAVRLNCSGQNLLSMSVFYQWGDTPQEVIPTKGGQNSFGNCKQSFRIPAQ
jgi:ribonuclease T2